MDTETTEARYFRASRTAHRAWLVTQPQFVIPGLLDALDAAPLSVAVSTAVRAGGSFERVLTAGVPTGVESSASEANHLGPDASQAPAVSTTLNPGGEPRHDNIPPEVTPHSSGAEPRHSSCPAPASVSTAGSVAASINATRTAPSSAQGLRGRPQKGA